MKIPAIIIPIAAFMLIINSISTYCADFSLGKDNVNIGKMSDSVDADDNESKYIPISEFMYSDHRLTLMNGDRPFVETNIKPLELGIFTGILAAYIYVQHDFQEETIWKDRGDFHFLEDANYAFYSDKLGHFYGAYLTSYLIRESLAMGGLSWSLSNYLGMALGLSYSTYIEISDGFAKKWGFSPSDFYADLAGAAFFIGQYHLPFLQNFTPKFMYFPADWHGERKRIPSDIFIDDYSSHTLWLSIDVHNLLPQDWKRYWPSWLELSVGYAARNLCDESYVLSGECDPSNLIKNDNGYYASPRYIIALDYNLVEILPEGGSFWNWIRQGLHYIKFPSPAVEFGHTTRVFLLYPFHF